MAELIALWLVLSPLIYLAIFILSVVFMFVVMSRLKQIAGLLFAQNRHLMAIRYPDLPWPGPSPNEVIASEVRDGISWRLRGDGSWEFWEGGRWRAPVPLSESARRV